MGLPKQAAAALSHSATTHAPTHPPIRSPTHPRYKHTRTCGVVEKDEAGGITKIAEPIGVVAGIGERSGVESRASCQTGTHVAHNNLPATGFSRSQCRNCPDGSAVMRSADLAWLGAATATILCCCLTATRAFPCLPRSAHHQPHLQ